MRLRHRALALAASAVLVLGGCADDAAPDPAPGGEQGFVAGDGSIILLAPAQRQAAPVVSGPLLSGGELSTADLAGAVVVLNVWASWCAPCRAEAPDLQAVWEATKDGGVQFVGLDTRDSPAAAAGFVRTFGLTYPQILDPDGRQQLLFRDTLPPQAIPSTVVLDKEGRVAARILGAASQSQLLGVIEPLVAEPSSAPVPDPIVVQP
jgi:thiol-disulfide isomerase/thioredoxin